MYFTAHGRAIPCCIAPFSMRGYDGFTLGDATQQKPAGDLERPALPGIPPRAVERQAAAGLCRLRAALEPVMPTGAAARRCRHPGPRRRRRRSAAWWRRSRAAGSTRSSSSTAAAATARSQGASAAGAAVVSETRRGYGRACRAGAEARGRLRDHRFSRRRRQRLPGADPAPGRADLPTVARFRDRLAHPRRARAGSMTAHQLARRPAIGAAIGCFTACATPICAPSARSAATRCCGLGMREMTYGWNLEMQMRAARAGLRILEIPVAHRRRAGGESKVSGNLARHTQGGLAHPATFARIALEARRSARAVAPGRR